MLTSAAEVGFAWVGIEKGWVRIPLPPLRMMSGPIQHFHVSILDAWRYRVFSKLKLLTSHLRERGNMLLRAITCGVFVMVSFLARTRRKMFLVGSVARGMEMVICFGSAPFSPCCMSGSYLSFSLVALDRRNWPRCLLWHGWLPGLSRWRERSPAFGQGWGFGCSGPAHDPGSGSGYGKGHQGQGTCH